MAWTHRESYSHGVQQLHSMIALQQSLTGSIMSEMA